MTKTDSVPQVGSRSVHSIRGDFPILGRQFGGKPLVYLDNAASTQKPRAVIEALTHYYETQNANVHRALYQLAGEATEAYESSRDRVRQFINARSTSEIIFTRGTTEAINTVAYSWGRENLGAGDEILLTEMEHHSNLIPWQMLAAEKGCALKFLEFDERGSLDMTQLEQVWSDRIKLVATVHMSNVFGTVNDVRTLIRYAHERGALVLLDGAQSVPHLPIDVQDLDCDFLAFSGHKMCAPMGIGVLYGKERILEETPPFMGGGEMISAVWLDHATWAELPHKFEAGTPNVGGAVALGAAIDYLSELGMDNVRAYEEEISRYAIDRLDGVPGLQLYGRAPERGAVFSFNLEGLHAHDLAQFLDREGVAVRAGHHCAHPAMRKLGIPATARASFYFYNLPSEADALAEALVKTQEFFGHGV